MCPTFKQALNRQKTCKKVIEKAKTTNEAANMDVKFTIMLAFNPPNNNKSRILGITIPKNNHTIFRSKRNKKTRRSKKHKKTRRGRKNRKITINTKLHPIDSTNINEYK